MLIKYVAASPKLKYYTGVLGSCNVLKLGRGASGIAKATQHIIQKFCTRFHGLRLDLVKPKKRKAVEKAQIVLPDLEEHIRTHIEMYDTDAAKDEMVAGRLLASCDLVQGIDNYLPNVLNFKKDSTHAHCSSFLP